MNQISVESESNRTATAAAHASNRTTAPVFVLGCPRSGTTMLYHMFLSAGNFAIYRTESNVFNLLVPRFQGMRSKKQRKDLLDVWLRSRLFRASGLNAGEISSKIMNECHSGGDFLRTVMQEIARQQGVQRWADCTPEHLLHIEEIKREIPDALFVHIIRDGRDVALSYAKQGWSHPLPFDRDRRLEVAGLYWQWLLRKGRAQGKGVGADYMEVRFEDLVNQPQVTLTQIGTFIGQDLDYQRIQAAGIGSVSRPNSSFGEEPPETFNPVSRWKSKMSPEKIAEFEELVGDFLQQLGYPLISKQPEKRSLRAARMSATYQALFGTKHWMRAQTPLGRYVRLERIEIESQSRTEPAQSSE